MRTFVLSLVVTALLSSSAPALINQMQNTQVGMANTLDLLDGGEAIQGGQYLALGNEQQAGGANQSLIASFGEVGEASGNGSGISIDQTIRNSGLQNQFTYDASPLSNLPRPALTVNYTVNINRDLGSVSIQRTMVINRAFAFGNILSDIGAHNNLVNVQITDVDVMSQVGKAGDLIAAQ